MIQQAKIEYRKIADLSNWEDNPRVVLEEDFARLIEQIKHLGMYKPLLVNQNNVVLGGNMRLRALRALEVTDDIAVTVVDAITPEKMLEYSLSDNDSVGTSDDLKLAELVHLTPIRSELFKIQSSTLRPLDRVVNPPDATSINEQEEWMGMPSFEAADSPLKLVVNFDSEQDRVAFVEQLDLKIQTKLKRTWITWHPYREKEDKASLKYE